MSKEKYYYFPPINPQFFFPVKNFKACSKFYKPLKLKSKIVWYIYKKSALVRTLFILREKDIPLQIDTIKNILNLENCKLFINLGTKGPEQKATIIAQNSKEALFLKFGTKTRAQKLIRNEINTLKQLQENKHLLIANIISFASNDEFTYLITNVFYGVKCDMLKINNNIYNYLISLTKSLPIKQDESINVFSHGDFCPWNILTDPATNKLMVIDWEMASYKPLGYDLFTFIFQTNFLLRPKKKCSTIIKENKTHIDSYFKVYKINNWQSYLAKFAELKVIDEESKDAFFLLKKYNELLKYNGNND